MNQKIAVIGSGIIGASLAFQLTTQGAEVSIFDKGDAGSGATNHSFAWINAFGPKRPRHYFDLHLRSISIWPEFCDLVEDEMSLKLGGMCFFYPDENRGEDLINRIKILQSWGYPIKRISKEELLELVPNLISGDVYSAAHCMDEGIVASTKFAKSCLNKISQLGGQIYLNTAVDSLNQSGDKISLVANKQEQMFDKIVICAGIDSTDLANQVGINLPQRVSPGVVVYGHSNKSILPNLSSISIPSIEENQHDLHFRQDKYGEIRLSDGNQDAERSDSSEKYTDQLMSHASKYFNDLSDVKTQPFPVGFRPMPIDGLPCIGFSKKSPNVYLAVMHSGVSLAPIVSRLASSEIINGISETELKFYRPDRFE